MSIALAVTPTIEAEAGTGSGIPGPDRAALLAAISTACGRIAPLWPLKHFVAVNPFLGFSGQSFAATCATLRRVARTDMLMPRSFYRKALADGEMDDRDLEAALAAMPEGAGRPNDVQALKQALVRDPAGTRPRAVVATVAEILDTLAAGDRQASRTSFMIDEISKWCAAYFDEGQANWRLPSRHLRPYPAWRASMRHDRNPEAMGIRGFRKAVAGLPDDPVEAIATVVGNLGIPTRAVPDYLHRALFDIGGWAAYARYLVWNSELHGHQDDTLVHLLAIRVAWGYALFLERTDAAFTDAWRRAMDEAAILPADERPGDDPDLAVDLILQDAYEAGYERRLLTRLAAGGTRAGQACPPEGRRRLQAAFCIDVRSEVYRRALETACPEAETVGFAGFFGFPIEYVPIGRVTGGAQCPVLLKPAFVVCEAVKQASEEEETEILGCACCAGVRPRPGSRSRHRRCRPSPMWRRLACCSAPRC
ncbi:putative inorganic carbon transporter subunit DabA [Skermanella pratensis]|uniref:putative inorganic carbon transporter subunit DabA n=1 Tax=Skermanella pratensis TaxID=2233999 RepID=UPI001B3B867E|nr:putative inorganic carbon transporter subunit DabA [Skermanella pratensis]